MFRPVTKFRTASFFRKHIFVKNCIPEEGCMFTSSSHYSDGPSFALKQKILKGQLKSDHRQAPVINSLQELYDNLKHYTPGKLLSARPPKGIYIYGSVGAGKTTLMDTFYESVKVLYIQEQNFI